MRFVFEFQILVSFIWEDRAVAVVPPFDRISTSNESYFLSTQEGLQRQSEDNGKGFLDPRAVNVAIRLSLG